MLGNEEKDGREGNEIEGRWIVHEEPNIKLERVDQSIQAVMLAIIGTNTIIPTINLTTLWTIIIPIIRIP